MTTTIYTISDINNILFEGFSYRLPEQNMKNMAELERLMGSSESNLNKPKSYDKKFSH